MIMDNLKLGKGLHMAHLNIRSITAGNKFELFKNQLYNSRIDVFTLSETWLSESIPDKVIEVPSYNITRLDRSWSNGNVNVRGNEAPKRGGGLAIFVREGIHFSDTKYREMNVSCKDLEMQWIFVKINHVRPILIVNVYRPPQGDCKKRCELLADAFNKAELEVNTEVHMLGDFNIDFIDSKSPPTKELLFTTRTLGLRQVIKTPTRTHFRNGIERSSLLDMIFTNSEHIKTA